MKNLIFIVVILFAVLFFGCSSSSPVQNYRFAGENDAHSFNVVFHSWNNDYVLFIDGKEVMTLSPGQILTYNDSGIGEWEKKKVLMEWNYTPGFLGIGRKTVVTVSVSNERVAQFNF
ncbi:MAG: hypothetical protein PHP42_08360 [Bacteroidota bacterium]|nr:hypothetical protein [Bacteroidota bacterium]